MFTFKKQLQIPKMLVRLYFTGLAFHKLLGPNPPERAAEQAVAAGRVAAAKFLGEGE
jgi:hypothetical protein